MTAPLTEEELDALDERAEGVFERDDHDELSDLAQEAMGAVHRLRALLADQSAELERVRKQNTTLGDELVAQIERAARLEALLVMLRDDLAAVRAYRARKPEEMGTNNGPPRLHSCSPTVLEYMERLVRDAELSREGG